MNISKKGIDLIKKYEGCRLETYFCPAGVKTIGYGHTEGVYLGMTITQQIAEKYLKDDLVKYEKQVTNSVSLSLTQSQFDALVSFTYNCGQGNLKTLIANRNHKQIADAILLYNKASGKVLNGLVKRRAEEQQMFLSEISASPNAEQDNSGIVSYSLNQEGETLVSKNFKVKEFKCKDGSDVIMIDVDFVQDKLQSMRDHFGVPITINSAYRTAAYNKKVGGASKSYHLTGQAFDIAVKGKTPEQVAKCAQNLCIKGIIRYNTFTHVDSRGVKYWARDNDGKISVVNNVFP